jgi:FkbM family methyltransferase
MRWLSGRAFTYSQTGEDLILSLFLDKSAGFYVDIGANHPHLFNNTSLFYNRGWTGINIEPNPNKIKLFKRLRKRDINLNIGISAQEDELDFFILREDTLSTFSPEISLSYQKMGHRLMDTKKIFTLPLAKVLERNLPFAQKIDFFSIDTEGFDQEVLTSNDWVKYRPQFIILETLEYKKDGTGQKLNGHYDDYLKNIGYHKIADTYINTIYRDVQN